MALWLLIQKQRHCKVNDFWQQFSSYCQCLSESWCVSSLVRWLWMELDHASVFLRGFLLPLLLQDSIGIDVLCRGGSGASINLRTSWTKICQGELSAWQSILTVREWSRPCASQPVDFTLLLGRREDVGIPWNKHRASATVKHFLISANKIRGKCNYKMKI